MSGSSRTGMALAKAVGRTLIAAALFMAACSGSPTAPPTTRLDTDTLDTGPIVTIASAGASPRNLAVSPGAQVTFINNDSRSHDMVSDPHPEHTDCPELNQVGFLGPGERRQTGNLTTVRTCGYHDHDDPLNTSLQGNILIR